MSHVAADNMYLLQRYESQFNTTLYGGVKCCSRDKGNYCCLPPVCLPLGPEHGRCKQQTAHDLKQTGTDKRLERRPPLGSGALAPSPRLCPLVYFSFLPLQSCLGSQKRTIPRRDPQAPKGLGFCPLCYVVSLGHDLKPTGSRHDAYQRRIVLSCLVAADK